MQPYAEVVLGHTRNISSNCLLLAAVLFRLPQPKSGIVDQRPSSHRHHCRLSVVI